MSCVRIAPLAPFSHISSRRILLFHGQRLLNDGLFGVFPNPMYTSFVLAIVPGLALDSWLVLTGSAVVYALFRVIEPSSDRTVIVRATV